MAIQSVVRRRDGVGDGDRSRGGQRTKRQDVEQQATSRAATHGRWLAGPTMRPPSFLGPSSRGVTYCVGREALNGQLERAHVPGLQEAKVARVDRRIPAGGSASVGE